MDRNIKKADHLYSDQLILYFLKELFINSVGSYWMNSNFIFSKFVNELFAIQEVLSCAIGDDIVDGVPYSEIVEEAREYINSLGGFEKFAEWGLF